MALFGSPNVEKLKAKADIKGLSRALRYKKDTEIRRSAARALGEIGDVRAVSPLVDAVRDARQSEDLGLLRDARRALVKIGAPGVELLIGALKDTDRRVCHDAAEMLGEIGEERAVPHLAAVLIDSDDYYMRERAVKALARIGDLRAVEPLVVALNDREMTVRRAVVRALASMGDTRAVPPLIAALEVKDLRESAAWALGELVDPRAIDSLIATLKDETPSTRKVAAQALERIGAPVQELLASALMTMDGEAQMIAVDVLESLEWQPDRGEAGAIYWIVKRKWDKCIELGSPAVSPLVATLKHGEWEARRAAAEALERLNWQPDRSEEGAAYWAAKQEWDRCVEIGSPAVEPLSVALECDQWKVRQAAAEALGRIGDARAVKPLTAALKGKAWEVCLAAARSLFQLGDDRGIHLLIGALKNKSGNIRRTAAETLVTMYTSGRLEDQYKRLILAQRATMAQPHRDGSPHVDRQGCWGHEDYDWVGHDDTGIGVDL